MVTSKATPKLPLVLVCTGFHRSGTSLTAQWLHQCGLPMGADLLPPHPSNPVGHFEDKPAVDLADEWLRRSHTNWLFHDETRLSIDTPLLEAIRAYAAARDDTAGRAHAWGVKDPRICLALPAWSNVLARRGRYLLVVRHWAECAQSLFVRHGRELAHRLPSVSADNQHLQLWRDPNLAFRAWLSYSQRLLVFAALNRGSTAVVTARGVESGGDLPGFLQDRLGLRPPRPEGRPALAAGLLSHRVNAAVTPTPPFWLRKALDSAWEELLALAELKSVDEQVTWTEKRIPASVRSSIQAEVAERFPDRSLESKLVSPELDCGDIDAQIAALASGPSSLRLRRVLHAAQRAFASARLEDCERLLGWAAASCKPSERVLALTGDVATARGNLSQALAAYRGALELEDSDANRIKCARCLSALHEWNESTSLLDVVIQRNPSHVESWIRRAFSIRNSQGPAAAAASLEPFPGENPAVLMTRAQLTMEHDYAAGNLLYRKAVALQLEQGDLVGWLASACAKLPDTQAWERLLECVYPHWRGALNASKLKHRLLHPQPPRGSSQAPAVASDGRT